MATGLDKAAQAVPYLGTQVAAFYLPTFDVVKLAVDARAANKKTTDNDRNFLASVNAGSFAKWSTWNEKSMPIDAAILAPLLGIKESELVNVWQQQVSLWKAGKQPDRPSPALLKLAHLSAAPAKNAKVDLPAPPNPAAPPPAPSAGVSPLAVLGIVVIVGAGGYLVWSYFYPEKAGA